MPSFKEIFDSVKNRNDEEFTLNEAYEIGEAAKALHDTQKATKLFLEWLTNDFAKTYRAIHMTPHHWENKGPELQMILEQKFEQLKEQVDSLDEYLLDARTEMNPQEHTWSKWDAT